MAGLAGERERDQEPSWVEEVRCRVRDWAEIGARDLPWRADRDPYRVLISEVMLVQTTVAAVVPYYERFLARFPTVEALAAAELAEVLRFWEGLGYYRRARQLHEAARAVVGRHGGVIPDDLAALRSLPGVGRYIAGAVLSFAFGRPAPIVEANTQRLLARLLGVRGDLASKRTQDRLWEAAARLVPPEEPGRFNQAMMDLGATVCLVRRPLCLTCPLSTLCEARRLGLQEVLPLKGAKPRAEESVEESLVVVDRSEVLLVRRGAGGLWSGFWEFPTIHRAGADPARRGWPEPVDLAEGVRRLTGQEVRTGAEIHRSRYAVTRYKVSLVVFEGTIRKRRCPELRPGPFLDRVAWTAFEELGDLAFSAPQRRLLAWLGREGRLNRPRGSEEVG